MERQRRLSWLESVSFFDGLTGLYNQHGFAAIAEHDIENARRAPMHRSSSFSSSTVRCAMNLALCAPASYFQWCFGETAVIARLAMYRFGVCTITRTEGGAEYASQQFERELSSGAVRIGTAPFSVQHPGGLEELLEEAEVAPRPESRYAGTLFAGARLITPPRHRDGCRPSLAPCRVSNPRVADP